MDKQIIKNIIIEKQIAIPNYKLVHRDFLFGDKSNYTQVSTTQARTSYFLYNIKTNTTTKRKENSRPKISLHQL